MVRNQAARTAGSCLGNRSLCFLPGLVTSQNTHHPFYYLGFYDVGLFSEKQRERLKEGEMEEWGRRGGRGREILIGCPCIRILDPIVKGVRGIGLSSGCTER